MSRVTARTPGNGYGVDDAGAEGVDVEGGSAEVQEVDVEKLGGGARPGTVAEGRSATSSRAKEWPGEDVEEQEHEEGRGREGHGDALR